jgi:hypothetical protein
MPLSTLPISRLINTTVSIGASAASTQSTADMMLVGTSTILSPNEPYRVYSSLAAVAADFGTSLPEYAAANLWFQQTPQPAQLFISRWANTTTAAKLLGAPLTSAQQTALIGNAATSVNFGLSQNGAAVVNVTASGSPLAATTNLNGVAAALQIALTSAIPVSTPTIVWNANAARFEITSGTTGATSALSYATTFASAATDISAMLGLTVSSVGVFNAAGSAAQTALATVANLDNLYGQKFYGLFVIGASSSDSVAIAGYIEAANTKHIYFVNTQDLNTLVTGNTTNVAYLLQQLAYTRTTVQYSSSSAYAAMSYAAKALTVDYSANKSAITMMYKQEPGITSESLSLTQLTALEGFNCNVFVAYNNNTAIIEKGTQASGDFTDIITGVDWLALNIQTEAYNLLYTARTKVPQTDAGNNLLVSAMTAVLDQAVRNGVIAPGVWQQTGFGALNQNDYLKSGYYVYAPSVDLQSASDRAARKSVPFQIAVKLAGAIHTVSVAIYVNR